MKISEIRDKPTVLSWKVIENGKEGFRCNGFHESLLRAHHVVDKVKHLLKLNTPQEVILEIIEEIEQ